MNSPRSETSHRPPTSTPAAFTGWAARRTNSSHGSSDSFDSKTNAGYARVLGSDATPIEKLDALSWVSISAMVQFPTSA